MEDDKRVAGFVLRGLKEEGYATDLAGDGDTAIEQASSTDYDAIVLDVMLPRRNGVDVCRVLRERGIRTPILMLTARDAVDDRVRGLNAGADDYLTKPFAFEEFVARIRALLRRSQDQRTDRLAVSDLVVDTASRRVSRNGRPVRLTSKEYALLEYMMRHAGEVLSETVLLEHVWDMNFDPRSNVVDVYIHHLRQKIDRGQRSQLIQTIRGAGYRITDEAAD